MLRYTQTVTLWHGLARVDCQTTIDEFTGVDRLVRLRWPCPVPGALPVSEVGDAVIGRGFGLMHERGAESAVDAAAHPWTLDNPAYGWFGLSSAARVRIGEKVRAVSVAEVVTPTASAPWARDLMVALVRAGVTATCSSADRPRYGFLDVDSNLPDARIALGGPDHNEFTAAVLADADPVYAEELKRQLYATGEARVWVPAAASLADEWVPGADLRRVRALPVLVIAGSRAADARSPRLSRTSPMPRSPSSRRRRRSWRRFDSRTVALLNRGIPSFAVDSDGTLHTSLMRSCTGWPSGTWIDPPRRTAPDGSNFQLQHWTHTFDYALVSGDGDWRRAGIPARSAEFSRPLLSVVRGDASARRAAGVGLAVRGRAGRFHCARCTQGGRQPAGRRQRPARRPGRRRGGPAGRNMRGDKRCRDQVRAAQGVFGRARRPTGAAACAAPRIRRADAARLRDRHRADPAQHAEGARRRPRPTGAG